MRLPRFLMPRTVVSAHCDLPCGVYDPAQARIEAESVKAIAEKYQANSDPEFPPAPSDQGRAGPGSSTTVVLVGHSSSALREVPEPAQLFNRPPSAAPPVQGSRTRRADQLRQIEEIARSLETRMLSFPPVCAGFPRTCRRRRDGTNWPLRARRRQCHLTRKLRAALFGPQARCSSRRRGRRREPGRFALGTEILDVEGAHGVHLEDLYVRRPPGDRGRRGAAGGAGGGLRRARVPPAGVGDAGLEPGRRVLRRDRGHGRRELGAVPPGR